MVPCAFMSRMRMPCPPSKWTSAAPGTFSTTLHFVCNIRSPSRRHLVSSTQLPGLDYVAHPEVVEHRDTMLNEQAERNCANNANTQMGFFTFLNSWKALEFNWHSPRDSSPRDLPAECMANGGARVDLPRGQSALN